MGVWKWRVYRSCSKARVMWPVCPRKSRWGGPGTKCMGVRQRSCFRVGPGCSQVSGECGPTEATELKSGLVGLEEQLRRMVGAFWVFAVYCACLSSRHQVAICCCKALQWFKSLGFSSLPCDENKGRRFESRANVNPARKYLTLAQPPAVWTLAAF